jgi:hypothetical protein
MIRNITVTRGNQMPVSDTRFPDMFCSFYFVKNHKFAKNSTATKGREKNNQFGILRFFENF